MFEEVWKLVGKGLAFVFPPESLKLLDADEVRVSPFGLVPKKHLGKPTGKVRPINHCSWPRKISLNDHTWAELERQCRMPGIADFARSNLRLRYMFPAARILSTKADAMAAFNHLFLDPSHVGDIAAEVAGHTAVSLVECIGHNVAPTKYCARADVIDSCHNAWEPSATASFLNTKSSKTDASPSVGIWQDVTGKDFGFVSDTYVDDGFLQGPSVFGVTGDYLDSSIAEYEALLKLLMGDGAVSEKNREGMVWSPAHVMTGLMHYTEAGGVGLPDGKRQQIKVLG